MMLYHTRIDGESFYVVQVYMVGNVVIFIAYRERDCKKSPEQGAAVPSEDR